MALRKIIKIDEEKCTGCGVCLPNCAEGALQIVNGKVKLVGDKFCDGLGACLAHCPEDALVIEERESEEFDVEAVEHHLQEKKNTDESPRLEPPATGCPSSRMMHFKPLEASAEKTLGPSSRSMLSHWPVQLKLAPVSAPYFRNADLLIAADCVPFAYPDFHRDFIKGRAVVVGCPKLDDVQYYREKLTEIFKANTIRSVTVPHMEVPCCFGLVRAVEDAIQASGKNIPLHKVKISVRGEVQPEDSEVGKPRIRQAL